MHTHNTDQCKKWVSDGTPKKKVCPYTKQNNANVMADTFKECFAQMRKDLKKDLRKSSSRKRGSPGNTMIPLVTVNPVELKNRMMGPTTTV